MSDREESSYFYPFKRGLAEKTDIVKGAFFDIKMFENDPRWIVKEISAFDDKKMTFERFRDELQGADRMIERYGSKLKRFIPDHHLVFLTNPNGENKGYIAMKRVDGVDLINMRRLSKKQVLRLEDLLESSVDFFRDSTLGTGMMGYFPDLMPKRPDSVCRLGNLMWGSVEDKKDFYLIDNFPLVDRIITSIWANHLELALKTFEREKQAQFSRGFIEKVVLDIKAVAEELREFNYPGWLKRETGT